MFTIGPLVRFSIYLRENNQIKPILRSTFVGPVVFLAKIRAKTPFFKEFRFLPWLQSHFLTAGVATVIFSLAFFNLFLGEKGNFILRADLGGPELDEEKAQAGGSGPVFSSTETVLSSQGGPEDEEEIDFLGYLIIGEDSLAAYSNPLTINASLNSRTGLMTYEVRPGDNPAQIAAAFGITTNTLLWANDLGAGGYIKPGQKLVIPPVSGVIHYVKNGDTVGTIAKKYGGGEEEIIAFNHLSAEGQLKIGDILVVPDGKMPASARKVTASGSSGGYVSLPNLAGYFIYPTTGWNWGRIHANNGVDIANDCYTTPIYAAAAGIIVDARSSGWNSGYGRTILIEHANGTETRYAHLDSLVVGTGDYVDQRQLIGYMGNTGKVTGVTGCHLHFEVHGARNPLAK